MDLKQPLYKTVNDWRVFPRLFSIFYLCMMYWVVKWGMSFGNEISMEASGMIGAIFGAGAAWFKFYVNSGSPNPSPKPTP